MGQVEKQFIPENKIVDIDAFDALPKIGFAGPPSSGKGTAADLLSSRYGFAQATFSQGIRDHLLYMHGIQPPYPRDLTKETGIRMIEAFGKLALYRTALKKTLYDFGHNPQLRGVVIDGFRWPQEGRAISELPNSYIIWIEADQELRKKRLFERARSGDLTPENFYEVDKMEVEWVEPNRQFTQATVINNGDIASFQSQIGELVEARFGLRPVV